MIASAALGLWLSRGTTFSIDELEVFKGTAQLNLQGALEPSSAGHLYLTWRLVFAAILNTLGTDYVAFRVLVICAVLLTAGLFFAFAERRVGALAALAPTLVLLFYGSDYLHAISGNGFVVLLSVAAGIAALLALEREDRRGDVGACLLLCLGIATFSSALGFLAAAAVLIMLGPDRWRRAWVFLLPAALYAGWLLWTPRNATQGAVTLHNLLLTPAWAFDGLATTAAALLGLNYPFSGMTNPDFGPVLAIVALAALGWRLWRGAISKWLWAVMAVPATLWLAEAARGSMSGFRGPETGRYIFPASIAVLLVAAEAARGVRFGRRATVTLYLAAAVGLATNIALLQDGSRALRSAAQNTRGALTAGELAGHLDPQTAGSAGVILRSTRHPDVTIGYRDGVRDFGSPSFSLAELRTQPELVKEGVDAQLGKSLPVGLTPAPAAHGRCRRVAAPAGGGASFRIPPGGAVITATRAADLTLRRFGSVFTVHAGSLKPGQPAALSIPRDSAPDPWYASTGSSGPVTVCVPASTG